MKFITSSALVSAAIALTSTLALADGQLHLIHPVTKELTYVFILKVFHPWHDVVAVGDKFAVEEFAKKGIKMNMI